MAAATVPDRLEHILRSIEVVLAHWDGKNKAAFGEDELGRAASERHLGIISRGLRYIPNGEKADHPQIAWKDIAGIGNILRHRYDTISDDRIWEIVTLDLPALRSAIVKIMAKHRRKR